MVTTGSTESSTSSSTTPEPVGVPPVRRLSEPQVVLKEEESEVTDATQPEEPRGVLGDIVNSIWEPGANATVIIAMNVSFFFLIMTLFGLAMLTNWMGHVVFLLVTSVLLWGAMVLFVAQMHSIQTNPENMPMADPLLAMPAPAEAETKKDK